MEKGGVDGRLSDENVTPCSFVFTDGLVESLVPDGSDYIPLIGSLIQTVTRSKAGTFVNHPTNDDDRMRNGSGRIDGGGRLSANPLLRPESSFFFRNTEKALVPIGNDVLLFRFIIYSD